MSIKTEDYSNMMTIKNNTLIMLRTDGILQLEMLCYLQYTESCTLLSCVFSCPVTNVQDKDEPSDRQGAFIRSNAATARPLTLGRPARI